MFVGFCFRCLFHVPVQVLEKSLIIGEKKFCETQ